MGYTTDGSTFMKLPPLPEPSARPCVAILDRERIFAVAKSSSVMFEDSVERWIPLDAGPARIRDEGRDHVCGAVNVNQGQLVVALSIEVTSGQAEFITFNVAKKEWNEQGTYT